MPLSKQNDSKVVETVATVSGLVIVAWLSWVSVTLVQLQEDITVLKYSVFKIVKSESTKPSIEEPFFAIPAIPFPNFKKEIKKNETRMDK